jgi:hypothetical protein
MTDKILALLSFTGLATFLSVVVVFVRELNLSIVIIGVLALAGFDFWNSFRKPQSPDSGTDG